MKRILPIAALVLAVAGAIFYFSRGSDEEQVQDIYYTVQQEQFDITVTATGELDAKNSVKIRGPKGMRAAGIYETTIQDLVTEGTIIKKGDYVASLDRTELADKMSTARSEIEKINTQMEQAKIDTAIELRGLRDDMVNMEFTLEESKLQVELNKYEAESLRRQTQLDMERTQRDYEQLQKRYKLKQQQAVAKINEIKALLNQEQMQLNRLQELASQFRIMAPDDGMLIYSRSWRGKKGPGDRLSAWDPVVAELPDLSDMISKTYVNEVDISKIKRGQDVRIEIDAFPDRKYDGSVIKVANIGEEVKGYDTKVFEVIVQVNQSDSIMRPAMTTSNEILVGSFADVVTVPLEALHSDSLSYVYLEESGKVYRNEVIAGMSNNDKIMIDYGLQAGDRILLSLPDKGKEYELQRLDPETIEEVKANQLARAQQMKQEARSKEDAVKDIEVPRSNNGGGGGGFIIID